MTFPVSRPWHQHVGLLPHGSYFGLTTAGMLEIRSSTSGRPVGLAQTRMVLAGWGRSKQETSEGSILTPEAWGGECVIPRRPTRQSQQAFQQLEHPAQGSPRLGLPILPSSPVLCGVWYTLRAHCQGKVRKKLPRPQDPPRIAEKCLTTSLFPLALSYGPTFPSDWIAVCGHKA